jgi:tRNA(fMet)-specific endonuclease VapC
VASRIAEVGEDSICTSIVVAAELRYGAEKSQSRQLFERIEAGAFFVSGSSTCV